MIKIPLTFILALVLMTKLFSQCADTANIYTFTFNGKTYEVVKELKTWADAAACAVERNGYLVEINDVNEQNAVYNAIINGAGVSPTYTSISNGGGIAYVWIGATDQQTEGTWLWDGNNDNTGINFWTGQGANGAGNGSSVSGAYYNWGGTSTGTPNEPDNYGSGQDNAAIGLAGWPAGTTMLGNAGEWNDIDGSSLLYFVIEKNTSTDIPEERSNLQEDMNIYPNPTNGILNIDFDYNIVEIYDLSGKLLKQFDKKQVIDLSDLNNYIYLMRISGDSFVLTEKVILN